MERGVKGFACLGIALPSGGWFSGDSWEQDNRGNLTRPSEGGPDLCRSFWTDLVAAAGIIMSFATHPTATQLSEKGGMAPESQWQWCCVRLAACEGWLLRMWGSRPHLFPVFLPVVWFPSSVPWNLWSRTDSGVMGWWFPWVARAQHPSQGWKRQMQTLHSESNHGFFPLLARAETSTTQIRDTWEPSNQPFT